GAVDRTVRARPPAGGAPAQVPGQPGPGLLPPPAEPGGAAGGPTGAEGSAGRVALAGGEVTPYRDGGLISRVSGALFATIAGIDFSCSAAVVDSPGGDLLVTAGHCLHEHGEFATNVIFIPGYQNGAAPYGVWRARRMTVTASWAREQDFDQDAGFVAVGADGGRRLADVVGGSLDIAFGPRLDPQVVFGYPKLPPFDGTTLMSCGGVPFPDPHGGPSIGLRCPMTAGASGGPWLARFGGGTGVVDSVVSYSYASDPSVIYGTSFGPVIERLYRHATQL
ncbi:MAG: signal peptide-containing protein, partial [Frankia sp.]|nr:signal peptide-containing protein [Frankia sp.]